MLQTLFGLSGRLSRTGFWEVVISVLLLDVAAAVAAITGLEHAFPDGRIVAASSTYEAVRWGLLVVAALSVWAVIAAHVKRAHDRGHGAGFLIWLIVPVIGWIWLVYELGFQPGQPHRNRFGPPPLGRHEDEHAGGERLMQAQPVSHDHGHHGLFHRGPSHRVVPVGPAQLDWTGAASEDSAEAHAHAHHHDDFDPGEALMRASEHHEPPPEPEPQPAALAPPHAAEHAFAPAALGPAPASTPVAAPVQPAAAHDDLSAAMGEVREHR